MSKPETAASAYARKQIAIRAAILRLQRQLEGHEACFFTSGRTNWGCVGDLGRTAELIEQAVESIGH